MGHSIGRFLIALAGDARRLKMRAGVWLWVLVIASVCAADDRQASGVAQRQPARVGSSIHGDEPVTKVQPTLPPEALARGVVGPVVLEIRISKTGNVSVLGVLRGHPLLDERAKAAVRRWKYRPAIVNGRVVPIIKVVAVSFVTHP